MALDQSALSELLDALRAGGDLDVVREGLALVLQALIEAEAAQQIGAGRYERSAARTTHRNGSRARLLSTKAGDVELKIPKLREGSFFPALLEPRRRIDRALLAVVMEAYVHGTSTRKVDDLVKALGVDAGISKSEVSRICGELDSEVKTQSIDRIFRFGDHSVGTDLDQSRRNWRVTDQPRATAGEGCRRGVGEARSRAASRDPASAGDSVGATTDETARPSSIRPEPNPDRVADIVIVFLLR